MQPLQCAAGVVEPALGAVAGLGRWFVGLGFCHFLEFFFQLRRRNSATTVSRALPVCEWPALWAYHEVLQGQMLPWQCVARMMEPALGAAAGLLGRWSAGCGFATLVRFSLEEAPLGNHSAQSPASM